MELLSSLAGFDWVVALIVGAAALFGLMRGFIGEVASLAAWLAGVIAVRMGHGLMQPWLERTSGSETVAGLLSVLLPFGIGFAGVRLAGMALSSGARAAGVGAIDRMLGLGFGMLKGTLAASLLFLLITVALKLVPGDDTRPAWLARARTTSTLALVASAMVSQVGQVWREMPELGDPAGLSDPHAGLPGAGRPTGGDEAGDDGYGRRDRRALDRLLDEQERQSPSTPI